MIQTCCQCNIELENYQKRDYIVTNGICSQCVDSIFDEQDNALMEFLNSIDAPILLMQPDPRQVRTANKRACDLFQKDVSQIKGRRGGQVFECIHAFTEAGCGKDKNCEDCKIKNSVVETFASGKSFDGVSTILDIKKNGSIIPYNLQVSTEKVGELALIRIDQYERKA